MDDETKGAYFIQFPSVIEMKNSEIIFKINQLEQHNVILEKEWNELNASEVGFGKTSC